jgi:four helix bundle protein
MTKDQFPMTKGKKEYDLAERTALFGEVVIDLAKKIRVNPVTERLISQLVGAGTSVGANYCEADEAETKKDFRHKIALSRKEIRETAFFLRMMVKAVPEFRDQVIPLWREARELNKIFNKIIITTDKSLKQ